MLIDTSDRYDTLDTPIETHKFEFIDAVHISRKNHFSVIILNKGNFTAIIGDVNYCFEAPTIICLDECQTIKILSSHNSNIKIINFDPAFINPDARLEILRNELSTHWYSQYTYFQLAPFLSKDDCISFRVSTDTMQKIEYSFTQLEQTIYGHLSHYWKSRAQSFIIDIINILGRLYQDHYIHNKSNDICVPDSFSLEFKQLLTYINSNLAEKHTLDSLYIKFRINKNQIERLFKKYLNTTFYEYLRCKRFEEATYYLRTTELDGEQIASLVGLSSSQNFCRFFRSICGKTPHQYRREMITQGTKYAIKY